MVYLCSDGTKQEQYMNMKRMILSFSFLVAAMWTHAQLTLETCQRMAQANYPLVRQYGLIEKAREYDLSNAGKGYLPQFSLSGKATYQSDVTELPVEVPGVNVKGLPKDQYQVMLEVQQTLWDGGDIRSRKRLTRAASEVEQEKQNVDMYALNDRINQLFFGILSLDEQLEQNRLLQDDLGRTHTQVSNYIANGIATQSDLDAVSVEQLNTKQRRIELETSRRAYVNMLAAFIGKDISPETALMKPAPEDTGSGEARDNNRPELRWFDARGAQLNVQESMLKTRYMPRLGLFVQGAYGNPGLNMLKNEFSPYYIAGVRMSWNFGSLYTLKNDRRQIDNSRRRIETSRDVFLFNTRLEATQQDAGVVSMRRQMKDDDEIIRLRENIRRAAQAKVENGTLTVTDMLREITNENLARQTKALHEVQLLMNIWQLKYTLNQ
jgi:outer membrane protein TolC